MMLLPMRGAMQPPTASFFNAGCESTEDEVPSTLAPSKRIDHGTASSQKKVLRCCFGFAHALSLLVFMRSYFRGSAEDAAAEFCRICENTGLSPPSVAPTHSRPAAASALADATVTPADRSLRPCMQCNCAVRTASFQGILHILLLFVLSAGRQ